MLELVLPIDLETKPADVEFLGFLDAEDAQNGYGARQFDRDRVTLGVCRRSDLGVVHSPGQTVA